MQGKYDAIVKKNNDKYEVMSIKGQKFEQSLEKVLNGRIAVKDAFASNSKRGVISNLMGFLTMLILLMGSILYKFYYQDKGGVGKRIILSRVRICKIHIKLSNFSIFSFIYSVMDYYNICQFNIKIR